MVMISRPGLENPVAADHKMPADPGRTEHTPGPLVDMPTPTIIGQSGEHVGRGPHSSRSNAEFDPGSRLRRFGLVIRARIRKIRRARSRVATFGAAAGEPWP